MWVGVREIGGLIGVRWPEVAGAGGATVVLWLLGIRSRAHAAQWRHEQRTNEELQAYARLDVRLPAEGKVVDLATRVSLLMAEKSAFHRTAMLLRDAQGGFSITASTGMDDRTVQSLNAWAARVVVAGERADGIGVRRNDGSLGTRLGSNSFTVVLGKGPTEGEYRRAIVVPLWTTGGRMVGALAVCADGMLGVRRWTLEEALAPMEALGVKVSRSMENAAVAEKLLRAEKLAGLGLLAGGMAHALSNPLTAVLGFAELIAGSTGEVRVKADAELIVREALRMRQTVETLMDFSRPVAQSEGYVDLMELVRELAAACADTLEMRGVRLVVQVASEVPVVRGNRHRLRQLLEHLLNNSAQAMASVERAADSDEQVIRMSVNASGNAQGSEWSSEEQKVHLIVSDTGPGFHEPGRVFDAFYAMQEAGNGAGLGLSICYGIVHELGGEIRAFNMHPHGAAVAVELPAAEIAAEKISAGAGERIASVSD
jgi:signal transduction histidine kinase